jgi:hypothetical protein
MDRLVQPDSEVDDQVRLLASQLRQALQTCSVHTVGPVAAYQRCASALEAGNIDSDQFRQIGLRVVDTSNERIRTYQAEEDPSVRTRKIAREMQVVNFVKALFSLDLVHRGG